MSGVEKTRISTLTVLLAAVCAAPGAGQPFRPGAEEPSCAGQPKGTACWKELESHPRCYVWTPRLMPGATVTWSAGCAGGLAQGTGTFTWKWASGEYEITGLLRAGKQHGHWVLRDVNGTVAEGLYVYGEKTGRWIERVCERERRGGTVRGRQGARPLGLPPSRRARAGSVVCGRQEARPLGRALSEWASQ